MTAQGEVLEPVDQYTTVLDLAIFSDGTFEGDERTARNLFLNRDGRRRELQLAIPLLREMIEKKDDAELLTAWEQFKIRISDLPQEEKARRGKANSTLDHHDPFWHFEHGMYEGRNLIQSQTEQLDARLKELNGTGGRADLLRRSLVWLINYLETWASHSI